MRYTFNYKNGTKTVNISDDWIKKTKINLNLTTSEAINLWLCDNGYAENAEAAELTAKAKLNKDNVAGQRKPRKAPERKPDETKRAVIQELYKCIEGIASVRDPQVTNIERMIAFSIGDERYEVTLSKKRKPKS